MQFSLSKELVNPKECSEAEMTLQSCPELGLEDQVFIQIHQPVIDTGFPGRGHDHQTPGCHKLTETSERKGKKKNPTKKTAHQTPRKSFLCAPTLVFQDLAALCWTP